MKPTDPFNDATPDTVTAHTPATSSKLLLWQRIAMGLLIVISMAGVLFAAGPRNAFGPETPAARVAPPQEITQLDAWVAKSESAWKDIRPGNQKGIVWNSPAKERTPWAVVYVHGFSASRLETAPLTEQVAKALGANVVYTRLTGHGRTGDAMAEASPQEWMADTLEAVQLGRTVGERVLVISCSTGSTLATWLGTRPEGQQVAAQVFVSPNFGPKDKRSEIINGPWGHQIAYLLQGDYRGEPSADPAEAAAWTNRYPTSALFPLMALVKKVRESDLSGFKAPVLVLYSERDQTVDPLETKAAFARFGSAQKVLKAVEYSEAKGQHVLAGNVRAPNATAPMAEDILKWLKGLPL